jgi:hypothetical protein
MKKEYMNWYKIAQNNSILFDPEERISEAAYYNLETGHIFRGFTHMEAMSKAFKVKEFYKKESYKTVEEGKGGDVQIAVVDGYITTKGRFITREEAKELTKKLKERTT